MNRVEAHRICKTMWLTGFFSCFALLLISGIFMYLAYVKYLNLLVAFGIAFLLAFIVAWVTGRIQEKVMLSQMGVES